MEPLAKPGAQACVTWRSDHALYGPLLGIFGPSTSVMIGTNLVVGLGSVLLAAVLARRLGSSALSGLFGLVLVGLIPALMRQGSESILILMVFGARSLVHPTLIDGQAAESTP